MVEGGGSLPLPCVCYGIACYKHWLNHLSFCMTAFLITPTCQQSLRVQTFNLSVYFLPGWSSFTTLILQNKDMGRRNGIASGGLRDLSSRLGSLGDLWSTSQYRISFENQCNSTLSQFLMFFFYLNGCFIFKIGKNMNPNLLKQNWFPMQASDFIRGCKISPIPGFFGKIHDQREFLVKDTFASTGKYVGDFRGKLLSFNIQKSFWTIEDQNFSVKKKNFRITNREFSVANFSTIED